MGEEEIIRIVNDWFRNNESLSRKQWELLTAIKKDDL